MTPARIFRRAEMDFKPAVTATGTTSIARAIDGGISRHMGGGIEYLEAVTIDWTVTYDEILFIFEGVLTIVLEDGEPRDCGPGDIVWLPEGTRLQYIARGRAGYFYALHPVDWAIRQGVREP